MNADKSEKYLLILGGNELACPAIKHLGELGYKTLVVDRDRSAPAKKFAHTFLSVNFSDYDETLKAIKNYEIGAIMALNDFGVRTAASLSQFYGLPESTLQLSTLLIKS